MSRNPLQYPNASQPSASANSEMSSTPDGSDHACALLFNDKQAMKIRQFIEERLPRTSKQSAVDYLSALDFASKIDDGKLYINLYKNGKIQVTDREARYRKINQFFQAPTGKRCSLFDHFNIKDKMETEMGRKWSMEDTEVREDFARVYVSNLQKAGLIERYY